MEQALREYVENIFKDAPNTLKAVELKEEIVQNLIEKYHDLLNEGKTEQAAYNISVVSIGDVNELLRSIEPTNNAAAASAQQKSTGTVFDSVNRNDLENLEFNFHSEKEQDKIENILGNIDIKIELNNEINNNLHELEKNLYKEYFKDLDDTNTQKLGDLCKIKYGKGLPTTKIETEGYSVYGGNGIIGYYHEFMYEESQVLISCRGAASGNVIVSKPHSFVTNNSLILECDRKYHHYLKQYSLDNYYYEYTTGSAQPQITIDNIKDIALNIPSEELLDKFNKQMEPLENKYFSNLEEISKLEQLRDALLPKLMNGEIDLDNIEI